MLTQLLWFVHAKQQHDMQRAQGLAGLISLLLVIFMVWQWDEIFLPVLNFLGLVDLANRVGLVHESPVITIINVLLIIFLLSVTVGLLAMALAFIGIVFSIFGGSRLGGAFLENAFFVLLLPFILPLALGDQFIRWMRGDLKRDPNAVQRAKEMKIEKYYKQTPELREEWKQTKDLTESARLFSLFRTQVLRDDTTAIVEEFPKGEKTEKFLNRAVASIENDLDWLIGYSMAEDQHFLLLPNPLPKFVSHCFSEKELSADGSVYGYHLAYTRHSIGGDISYHVPAVPIDFEWDGYTIQMKQSSRGELVPFELSRFMSIYRIQAASVGNLYQEVSRRYDVKRAILNAHLALYIIPIAYMEKQMPTGAFNPYELIRQASEVPNAEVFSIVYAADIKEKIEEFADRGESWAVKYMKQTH